MVLKRRLLESQAPVARSAVTGEVRPDPLPEHPPPGERSGEGSEGLFQELEKDIQRKGIPPPSPGIGRTDGEAEGDPPP